MIPLPNWTAIPNLVLDEWMRTMDESELKVVLTVARKTIGWQKERDRISLTQFMALTGMARQSVLNGISKALDRHAIYRERTGKQGWTFGLLMVSSAGETVKGPPVLSLDQLDQTGLTIRPKPVYSLDPQKKKEIKKNNKDGARTLTVGELGTLMSESSTLSNPDYQVAFRALSETVGGLGEQDARTFYELWTQHPDPALHAYALQQMRDFADTFSLTYYGTVLRRQNARNKVPRRSFDQKKVADLAATKRQEAEQAATLLAALPGQEEQEVIARVRARRRTTVPEVRQ